MAISLSHAIEQVRKGVACPRPLGAQASPPAGLPIWDLIGEQAGGDACAPSGRGQATLPDLFDLMVRV